MEDKKNFGKRNNNKASMSRNDEIANLEVHGDLVLLDLSFHPGFLLLHVLNREFCKSKSKIK